MFLRILKLLISIIFFIINYVAQLIRRSLGQIDSATCVILYYHVVTPYQRELFAKQMDTLKQIAKPASLDIGGFLEPGCHYAAISFDDGFYSFVEIALPELIQRNIPVTVFVPSGKLGEKPDWLSINYRHSSNETVMTSYQLKELAEKSLVTIGSHGMTHKNMLYLEEQEVIKEIFESKHILESITKKKVELLSFPYGGYKKIHLEYARSAGYKYTFGNMPTMAFHAPNDYLAGRVPVEPTDYSLEFRLKTLGAYRWIPIASYVKHKIPKLLYSLCKGNK